MILEYFTAASSLVAAVAGCLAVYLSHHATVQRQRLDKLRTRYENVLRQGLAFHACEEDLIKRACQADSSLNPKSLKDSVRANVRQTSGIDNLMTPSQFRQELHWLKHEA